NYGPHVTITKAISILAPPGIIASMNPSGGEAITITALASDTVVIRGLTLNGSAGGSFGILVDTAGDIHVENCVITGFSVNGIAETSAGNFFVKDTVARGSGDHGVNIEPPDGGAVLAVIDRCPFIRNAGN